MVVKKNKVVLEALRDRLIYHKNLYDLDIPVLVVDDEAIKPLLIHLDPNKRKIRKQLID